MKTHDTVIEASYPEIEYDYLDTGNKLMVTVGDWNIQDAWVRRKATEEETIQAILYWIKDIHDRIGGPK